MATLEIRNVDTAEMGTILKVLFQQTGIVPQTYRLDGRDIFSDHGVKLRTETIYLSLEVHVPKTKSIEVTPDTVLDLIKNKVLSALGNKQTREVEYTERSMYRISGTFMYPVKEEDKDNYSTLDIEYYDIINNQKYVLKRVGSAVYASETPEAPTPLSVFRMATKHASEAFNKG
jgi:hypothetical protein|nr:MAG TPA: hypothetical protein [Caudoviricetes sp.]